MWDGWVGNTMHLIEVLLNDYAFRHHFSSNTQLQQWATGRRPYQSSIIGLRSFWLPARFVPVLIFFLVDKLIRRAQTLLFSIIYLTHVGPPIIVSSPTNPHHPFLSLSPWVCSSNTQAVHPLFSPPSLWLHLSLISPLTAPIITVFTSLLGYI